MSKRLSDYHRKYRERSDEELRRVFEATPFQTPPHLVRIAVLECADARFVLHHKRMFEMQLNAPVDMTTFDIAAGHLQDEKGFVRHDVTLPLPDPPYDIVFSHVLLKFIETEKQWDVIRHSFDALRSPGLVIHVFDEEDT